MKAIKLYKIGKFFQEEWNGEGCLYRTNVTEQEQDSFLHSLYYGPAMIKMNPHQRDEWIMNKRKDLLYRLSLSKFFVYEHGFIALRRIQYLLKSKHYDLKSLLEDERFNEQLYDFSMEKKYLTCLAEIVPKHEIHEILGKDFESICQQTTLEEDDGEVYQNNFSNLYVQLIIGLFCGNTEKLKKSKQLPHYDPSKEKQFLKKLRKTLEGFFNYVCHESLEDLKKEIEQQVVLEPYELFHIMGDEDYNILVVDRKSGKLFSDIDYEEMIDPEKKCRVLLYCDDNIFQPVHIEYEYPSVEEDMKILHVKPSMSFDQIKTSHETYMREFNESETQKSDENIKQYSDRRESFQKLENFYKKSLETNYEEHVDFERNFDKKYTNEKLFHFHVDHPFIEFLLNK